MKVTIAKSNLLHVAGIQPTHNEQYLLSKLCNNPRHSGKQFPIGTPSQDNENVLSGKNSLKWLQFTKNPLDHESIKSEGKLLNIQVKEEGLLYKHLNQGVFQMPTFCHLKGTI